jgi:hypothetical protein
MITILHRTRIAHTNRPAHRQTGPGIRRSMRLRGASVRSILFGQVLVCLLVFAALSFSSCISELTTAVYRGDVEEVKRLVEDERVDINSELSDGTMPLIVALRNNDMRMMTYLVEHGADVNVPTQRDWEGGATPLQIAVQEGSFEMCSYLLDKGANVHARDDHGYTAFLRAARDGRVNMLKCLLDRGADINDRMKYWKRGDSSTALIIAARYDRDEAVDFLKAHGLSISNERAVFMVGFEMRKQEHPWPVGDVVLKTIDGKDMEGYGLLELEPGIHTAVLMYLSESTDMDSKHTITGLMSRVHIVAERGHIYVVHANLAEDTWMPVVRDYYIR